MAIHIVADSTCDLPAELIQQFGIRILPLYVRLGDDDRRDGVDIRAEEIFKHVAAGGALPKTAAVTAADFEDCFKQILSEDPDGEIICITISAKFSSCYQNACIAADGSDRIFPIDSMNLSTGFGHVVICACEMAQEGLSASEIKQKLEHDIIPKVDASFILDRLDFLHKGGRCSGVAALGANLLRLKPCIIVKNGEMAVGKKYRGNFVNCVKQYAKDRLSEPDSIRMHRIFVTHAAASAETVSAAKEVIAEAGDFEHVNESTAGCTVSSHCGPNTIGVLFIRK